jgi:hypothetical protein
MSFIKKLMNMKYTREVILFGIAVIAIFGIHQSNELMIVKIIFDFGITFTLGILMFAHLEKETSYYYCNTVLSFLTGLSFAIIVFSICGLIPCCVSYAVDAQLVYTKHYIYQPRKIIKDSNEVTVIGKNIILKSDKISDYLSNDLKICKDERYSTAKIRLSDIVYICK